MCRRCGLLWSDPFPHDPRHYYEKEYRISYKDTYTPKPKHILRAGKVALDRFRRIRPLLSSPKSILDVGTGGGEFAYLLKRCGHGVRGIEPNEGYADYSIREYGLDVRVGFVQDIEFQSQSFDLITIWHVLEHTEDPCTVLSRLRGLLKPDGVLVVEVPNIEATCQSPKSTFHEAHLFNFNLKTLQRIGEKVGLAVESSVLAEDGGNITMFFRQDRAGSEAAEGWAVAGNAEHIAAILRGHTAFRHYMTAAPYVRLLRRVSRSILEGLETRGFVSGMKLLDELYDAHAGSSL